MGSDCPGLVLASGHGRSLGLQAVHRECVMRKILIGLLLVSSWASASTVYVDSSASTDGSGSQTSPKKFISTGAALLRPGDVLEIAPGTYGDSRDSISSVPVGSSSAWITIQATDPGTVRITAPLDLPGGNHYLILDGLKFDSSEQKVIQGNYVKVLNTSFRGGPSSGNAVTLLVGTNNATPGASNILIQDSWVYGPGGRYKVLVYNAENVVLRRVLTRHDGGWSDTKGDPSANITIYDSRNVSAQNVIAMDDANGITNFMASFLRATNGTTSTPNANTEWKGCISINSDGWFMGTEGVDSPSNHTVTDCASINSSFGISQQKGVNTYTRMTVVSPGDTCFASFGAGSANIVDSVCVGPFSALSAGASLSNTLSYSSLSAAKTAGLSYLLRPEASSTLGTTNRGARIVKRIGADGTLYGEPGFNGETIYDLWPWPNEARIKADLSDVSRGLTATSKSLTTYIWEQLGSASPISGSTPSPTPPPAPAPTPAPTVTFAAAPATVVSGSAATLTWSSTNATSCTASGGWSGSKTTGGSQSTGNLAATTAYALVCSGAGGSANRSVSVTVTPAPAPAPTPTPPPTPTPAPVPTLSLSASAGSVVAGNGATLTWNSANATTCTASGGWTGSKALTGIQNTASLSSTTGFTLACAGAGGTVSRNVSVTVTPVPVPVPVPAPAPKPAPTVSLSSALGSVTSGGATMLNWSSSNATSCVAVGGWTGNKGMTGSQTTGALNASTTYTLACSGTGGSAAKSVTVTVLATPTASTCRFNRSISSLDPNCRRSWITRRYWWRKR